MELCPCYEVPNFIAPPPEPWFIFSGKTPPLDWQECPGYADFLRNNGSLLAGNSMENGNSDMTGYGFNRGNETRPKVEPKNLNIPFNRLMLYSIVGCTVVGIFAIISAVLTCRYYQCLCYAKKKSASKHMLSTSSSASSAGDRITHWTYDYMRPMSMAQSQMTLKDHPSEMHYASTDIYATEPHRRQPGVATVLSSPTNCPLNVGFVDGAGSDAVLQQHYGRSGAYDGVTVIDGNSPQLHNYESIDSVLYEDNNNSRFMMASSRH